MDTTQEKIQFFGFLGICAKSINIIASSKKIFFQIALTLILPLLVVFFTNRGINKAIKSFDTILDVLSIEYWVNEVTYFTFLAIFSLLSISTVVYSVTCVYSHNQVTYKMVMSFIPKVWNRLLVTLLYILFIFFVYNILANFTLVIIQSVYSENDMKLKKVIVSTIYTLYFIGFVYIGVLWQLASVISVLEESYGFRAIEKSKALMKGKMGISATIFLELHVSLGCINMLFEKFIVYDDSIGVIWKVGFGGLMLMLRFLFFLFGVVVQTITYFACESSINDSTLTNHYDVYLGGYVRLESKDVTHEQV